MLMSKQDSIQGGGIVGHEEFEGRHGLRGKREYMEIPFDSGRMGSTTAMCLGNSASEWRRCRTSVGLVSTAAAGNGAARKRSGEVVVLYGVGPMREWDGDSSWTRTEVDSADIPQ